MHNDKKDIVRAWTKRPIAYNPIFARATGSVTAGILMSQVMYWWSTLDDEQDEFYKSDAEFRAELGMGIKEFKNAKRKVEETNMIEVTIKGTPPTSYYRVNYERVEEVILLAKRDNSIGPKGTNRMAPKGPINSAEKDQSSISTENTSESTTERRSLTPSQEMKLFIESEEFFDKVVSAISEKYNVPETAIRREMEKFRSYWSEKTKSGRKQKWETKETFELRRRIVTWLSKAAEFNRSSAGGKGISIAF